MSKDAVIRTEILGNDGVHEWGKLYFKSGLVVDWCENLKARTEMLAAIRNNLRTTPQK